MPGAWRPVRKGHQWRGRVGVSAAERTARQGWVIVGRRARCRSWLGRAVDSRLRPRLMPRPGRSAAPSLQSWSMLVTMSCFRERRPPPSAPPPVPGHPGGSRACPGRRCRPCAGRACPAARQPARRAPVQSPPLPDSVALAHAPASRPEAPVPACRRLRPGSAAPPTPPLDVAPCLSPAATGQARSAPILGRRRQAQFCPISGQLQQSGCGLLDRDAFSLQSAPVKAVDCLRAGVPVLPSFRRTD